MEFSSLLEAIAHYAEATPDKVCLIEAETDKKFTYSEFWRQIRIFAKRLRDTTALQKGDRVTVRAGGLLETMTAQFGIHLAGGVYCPLGKEAKPVRVLEMLEYFDSKMLISTESVEFDGEWIDLLSVCDAGEPLENYVYPNPDDMCAIFFTTGTTGKAKGVMLNYKSCLFVSEMRRVILELTEKDVSFWTTPLNLTASSRIITSAFLSGSTAVHLSKIVFIGSLCKAIEHYGVTILHIPPSEIRFLLQAIPSLNLNTSRQIRAVQLGGAVTPLKDRQQLQQVLPRARLTVSYASTEIASMAYYEYSAYPDKANCVGKAYPGTTISFVDEKGNPVKTSKNNLGIVSCTNENLMLGYWKDPELTAKTVIDGKVIMTDLGYEDEEGFLYIMGRRDDIIATGGNKVAPYEIEDVVLQMPDVLECACIGVPHEVLDNAVKLFVVMKPGGEFSAKKISGFIAERLETHKVPRIICEIEALPRVGGQQKVDRKALREIV